MVFVPFVDDGLIPTILDFVASHAQYEYWVPPVDIPTGVFPPRIGDLATGSSAFPSYVSGHPTADFSSQQQISLAFDPPRAPAGTYARAVGEDHGYQAQNGFHGWFDQFERDRNYTAHQGGVYFPLSGHENTQGGSQGKAAWEHKGHNSNSLQHYPGESFPETDFQSLAHIAHPPPSAIHQNPTGVNVHIPVYPMSSSHLNDQMLASASAPLGNEWPRPLAQPQWYPQTGRSGRNSEKRIAHTPYPDIQQRENMSAGSAVTRRQTREDRRVGEGLVSVPVLGHSRFQPDQDAAEGSQLARTTSGSTTLQQTRPPIASDMDNNFGEGSWYGDCSRLYPPSHNYHAEPAMSGFHRRDQNLQQRGQIPPVASYQNYRSYSYSHLARTNDRNTAPHAQYPYHSDFMGGD